MKNTKDPEKQLQKADEAKEQTTVKQEIFSWIRMFAIVIIVVLVVTKCVIINAKIPSGSMENTIMTHDRLIGFRFSYWFDDPKRGDIILFRYPLNEKETYIKRVIGEPGDKVQIREGKVYINDATTPLNEDYLKETWVYANDGYTFQVPEDCYFVMGDNRNDSLDGRFWAQEAIRTGVADNEQEAQQYSFVKRDEVQGKAIFTYYSSFRLLNKEGSN